MKAGGWGGGSCAERWRRYWRSIGGTDSELRVSDSKKGKSELQKDANTDK